MNSTRYSKKVWGTAAVLLLAIAGGVACTAGKGTKVAGVKIELAPAPTVIPTAPLDPEFEVNDAPAEPVRKVEIGTAMRQVRQPRRTAQYTISLGCSYMTRTRDSAASSLRSPDAHPVRAGLTLAYDFDYQRDESPNPIIEETQRCGLSTQRTRDGDEPRLRVLLSCTGEATYTSNPQPTSTDAGAWRPSELLSGHTHVMTAPKSPEHISENVRCTVSVVSR